MFNPVDTQAGRQADWQKLYRHNIYGLDQQSKMVEKPHYSPTAFNNHTEHGGGRGMETEHPVHAWHLAPCRRPSGAPKERVP